MDRNRRCGEHQHEKQSRDRDRNYIEVSLVN